MTESQYNAPATVWRLAVQRADPAAPTDEDLENPVQQLQRKAGNAAVTAALQREVEGGGARSPVLDVIGRGGGRPLEAGVRTSMEQRLGADLSDVRVHTDHSAAESAAAVGARAYTSGHEVVFGQGEYQPGTADGDRTLAHELTHVVQQRSGPVDGTDTGDGIAVSDPGDRFEQEAEAVAARAAAPEAPAAAPAAAGSSVQALAIQREAAPGTDEQQLDEEGKPIQQLRVQREMTDDEDKLPEAT